MEMDKCEIHSCNNQSGINEVRKVNRPEGANTLLETTSE